MILRVLSDNSSADKKTIEAMRPHESTESPLRLLVILSSSIFAAEILVMILLSLLPPLSVFWGALLDALLMLLLILPTLYLLVFRPLVQLIEKRKIAETALWKTSEELEVRVRERTGQLEAMNEELHDEVEERKRLEGEKLRNLKNMEYVSITGTYFLEEHTGKEIIEYTAKRIAGVLENELVVVSEYDDASHCAIVRSILGYEQSIQSISRILGREVIGLKLPFDPKIKERLKKGMLAKVEGGLYALAFRQLPEQICLEIERELGLEYVFAMPFAWEHDLLGMVAILTRGKVLPRNVRVVETIVNQAAIALKRVRMQEEVRRSEERFRIALQHTPITVFNQDRELRYTWIYNLKVDLSPDDIIGRTDDSFVPPEHAAQLTELKRKVLASGVPIHTEVSATVLGSTYYYDFTLEPLYDAAGNIAGITGATWDITDRKWAEEALRRRVEEYRLLMEEASDGVFIGGMEKGIVAVNQRLCELLGYEKNDLLDHMMSEFLPEEDQPIIPKALIELNEGRAMVFEHRLRRKDGTLLHVETNAKRLVDGRVQGIVRDISVQKARQQQFTQAIREEVFDKLFLKLRVFKHGESGAMSLNRVALFAENLRVLAARDPASKPDEDQVLLKRFELAVEEYTSIVAPELAHIASLAALIEIGENRPKAHNPSPSAPELLRSLSAHLAQRLRAVVTSVRDSEGGISDSECQALQADVLTAIAKIRLAIIDISNYIEANYTSDMVEVLKIVTHKFESLSSGAIIECQNFAGACKVIFNMSELSEVLSILIENSIEAFGRRKNIEAQQRDRIRIWTEKDGAIMRLILEDNGPGVPIEFGGRIFEDGISGKSADRGFGLSYARDCVTKYGGRIYLDPTAESGVRFVIEIPKA